MSQLLMPNFKDSDLNPGLTKSINLHKLLCICCLNRDGPLMDLRSCSHTSFLDNFNKLPFFRRMICYHCHTMLVKIQLFKQQVEETFKILISEKDPSTNPQITKLQIHKAIDISIQPNDINQQPKETDTNRTKITLNDMENFRKNKNIATALDILGRHDQIFGLKLQGLKELGLIAINKTVEALIATKSIDSQSNGSLHAVSVSNEYKHALKLDEAAQSSTTPDIEDSSTTSLVTTECITVVQLTKQEFLKERESLSQSKAYEEFLYKCTHCLVGFYYEENLEDHMKRKHGQKTGSTTCEVCLQTIYPPDELEAHNNRHFTRFECRVCKERFSLYDDAHCHFTKTHVKNDHSNCNMGGSIYKRKHRKRYIRQTVYGNKVRPHRCTICYKGFTMRGRWKSHIRSHHGAELTGLNHYICDYCGNFYENRQEIIQHIKDHREQT